MKIATAIFVFLLCSGALLLAATHQPQQMLSASWMLTYCGKSEDALRQDKRFDEFLRQSLPAVELPDWGPVNRAAITFLGGVPGILEIKGDRYVLASGCPAHACVARGMLWIDLQANTAVFAATADEQANEDSATRDQYPIASAKVFIATKTAMKPDSIPGPLRDALFHWLHREGVLRLAKITLLESNGAHPITTEQLCWTGQCALTKWTNYW